MVKQLNPRPIKVKVLASGHEAKAWAYRNPNGNLEVYVRPLGVDAEPMLSQPVVIEIPKMLFRGRPCAKSAR